MARSRTREGYSFSGERSNHLADRHLLCHDPARMKRRLLLFVCALSAVFCGHASAATHRGSFDRPPYYDGKVNVAVTPTGWTPIAFRSDPAALDPTPDRSPALAALLDSLREEMGRLGLRVVPVDPRQSGAPDVRFGARRGGTETDGTPRSPEEIDPAEPRRMNFEVEGPSKKWREALGVANADSVRAVLTIQLGFDEHWVRQKDWKGNKTIALGTGRAMAIPWLTLLDDPVQVLQVTGALLTTDGRVVRVGAEGLIARRTGMGASVLGAQEVLTEDDLRDVFATEGGTGPVWRLALRALVAGLLGQSK